MFKMPYEGEKVSEITQVHFINLFAIHTYYKCFAHKMFESLFQKNDS